MTSLFRGRGGDGPRRLHRELAALEEQARTASPGYETQFLNRAGNLCVESGQPERALAYYGRAIDAYLESGRFSAAEVLCRKVLQIAPNAGWFMYTPLSSAAFSPGPGSDFWLQLSCSY